MLMKKGVDRLLSDKFYRQMYENFKEREGQYPLTNYRSSLTESKIIDQSLLDGPNAKATKKK